MALLVTSCGFLGIGWNQWFSVVKNILEYQRVSTYLRLNTWQSVLFMCNLFYTFCTCFCCEDQWNTFIGANESQLF